MSMRSDISKVAKDVALKKHNKRSKSKAKEFGKTNIRNVKGIFQ